MQDRIPRVLSLLAASLTVFAALAHAQLAIPRTGTTKPVVHADVPAEFKAAIGQLSGAKSSLEKAGDKWGGYRVKAIRSIDQILKEVGDPQVKSHSEMKSGNTDEPAALQSGISQLNAAKSDFQNSGNQWGGRRAKAISLIDQALKDLQLGIEYAKSHKTY